MSLSAPDLIRAPSRSDDSSAEAYDFARPRALSDRQRVAAEAAHAAFADAIAATLTDALGVPVSVRASTLDVVDALDFRNSRPRPTAFTDLRLGAIGPLLGLDLAPPLALMLVGRHLGGSDPIGSETRALSDLEQSVVASAWLPLLMTAFAETWGTIPPTPSHHTSDPDRIDLGAERLAVTDFEVSIGDTASTLSVAYPIETLRVLLEVAMSRPASAPRAEAVALGDVPVGLRAELGRTRLSIGDLLGLQPGDVIPLGHLVSDPIPVYVGTGLRFEASTGLSGSHLALRVLTPPAPPPHD